ncbi:MAG: hypothetical protein ACJ76I_12795 [Gaiellaceae bacterium]
MAATPATGGSSGSSPSGIAAGNQLRSSHFGHANVLRSAGAYTRPHDAH